MWRWRNVHIYLVRRIRNLLSWRRPTRIESKSCPCTGHPEESHPVPESSVQALPEPWQPWIGSSIIYRIQWLQLIIFFPRGVTAGCDLIQVLFPQILSRAISVGSWADTGGTATHQHPSLHPPLTPVAPLLRKSLCSLGANCREQPALTYTFQKGQAGQIQSSEFWTLCCAADTLGGYCWTECWMLGLHRARGCDCVDRRPETLWGNRELFLALSPLLSARHHPSHSLISQVPEDVAASAAHLIREAPPCVFVQLLSLYILHSHDCYFAFLIQKDTWKTAHMMNSD